MIASEIVIDYSGKWFEYTEEEIVKRVHYLIKNNELVKNGLKGFTIYSLGKFLLSLSQGEKEYEVEQVVVKQAHFKESSLINALFCVCSTDWWERENHWFEVLVLNTLYYLEGTKMDNGRLKEIKDKLDLKVEHVVNEGISINHTAFNNTFSRTSALARDYHNRLIDTLAKEPAKRDTVFSKSLRNGNYIYQSKLGICEVQEVSDIDTTTGSCLLLLSRPGFEWDKEKKEFLDSTPANRRFRKNIVVKF